MISWFQDFMVNLATILLASSQLQRGRHPGRHLPVLAVQSTSASGFQSATRLTSANGSQLAVQMVPIPAPWSVVFAIPASVSTLAALVERPTLVPVPWSEAWPTLVPFNRSEAWLSPVPAPWL